MEMKYDSKSEVQMTIESARKSNDKQQVNLMNDNFKVPLYEMSYK